MSTSTPPPLPAARTKTPRSTFITALGWIAIVCGCIGVPISFISLLMVMANSYDTSQADPLGFLIVVFGPAASIVAGIGLLRRKRWGWSVSLALLCGIVLSNVWQLVRSMTTPNVIVSATGAPTTTISSGIEYYIYLVPWMVICVLVILRLLSSGVRAEFPAGTSSPPSSRFSSQTAAQPQSDESADRQRGWRVGHRGRDSMYYEEWREGTWQCIEIDGEMLMGRAHHIIYFASPEKWLKYPAWVQYRRDEIIARIKSEFREPDYEYHGGGPSSASSCQSVAPPSSVAASFQTQTHASRSVTDAPSRWVTLGIVVLLFIALTVFMFWLVQRGLVTDQTVMPNRLATLQRTITREDDAFSYWFSITFYAVTGLGSAWCAFWLLREASSAIFKK